MDSKSDAELRNDMLRDILSMTIDSISDVEIALLRGDAL
jgi:hypothetical protein